MQAAKLAAVLAGGLALLSGCAATPPARSAPEVSRALPLYPNETPELRGLIDGAAARYDVPEDLVQRVVIRESRHRPEARNGPYWGLMQILPATARSMGFTGKPEGLLDPATNLEYAVRYLRGAWLVSGGDRDRAVGLYAKGYYHEAKAAGLLEETGLR